MCQLKTGKANSITIQSDSSLSDEEIEKLVREAEENAEADKSKREEADLRNEADQLIFVTKKAIEDLGDKVTDSEKEDAEAKMKELEEALKGNNLDMIKTAKANLEKSAQGLSERVYKEQQQQEAQGAEQQNQDYTQPDDDKKDDEDDVFDADYKEM